MRISDIDMLRIGSIVTHCHDFDRTVAFWMNALGYVYTDDPEREVERLLTLGATRYRWRYRPGADFVVLADPDGNLFCVVHRAAATPQP